MNTVAYCPLLYGTEYLYYSIRSVINEVDQYVVLYTPEGSYGHKTAIPCPDSRDDLYRLARLAAKNKLVWIDGTWNGEGNHRDTVHDIAPDADLVVPVDYDEIFPAGLITMLKTLIIGHPYRFFRLPMIHLFRSFHWAILHDPSMPIRAINPRNERDETTLRTPPIVHAGYAISPAMMRWKWLVHGHKNELRTDVDYFRDIYEANRRVDCHPCGNKAWNAEPIDPMDYMPAFMQDHPFYDKEVIE